MKSTIAIMSALSMSFLIQGDYHLVHQTWSLRLITVNSDTIFIKGSPEFTYRYNYLQNSDWVKNKDDSMKVLEKAKENYSNTKNLKIAFITDSIFLMTKMRSGGRIYPLEMDTGRYELKQDTIFMTNRTRRDYKQVLLISDNGNKMTPAGNSSYKIYCEYRKDIE